MNIRTPMSEQKSTRLTLTGVVALCVTGVLTLVAHHFGPWDVSANLAWATATAAAGSVGAMSVLKCIAISGRPRIARPASRREFGTTIAFVAIYFAFAALLLWSVFSSSEEIQHAGNAALWFSLAFVQWDTWRRSRHMPEST
jgi:hypothetical protein